MLEEQEQESCIRQIKYSGSEQYYNAAKVEYDYEIGRNSALDSKVSIAFAFCGGVVLFLINYLDIVSIWNNYTVQSRIQCVLRVVSTILQIGCLICFLICVVKLFLILKPKQYYRLDLDNLLEQGITEWEPEQANMYIGKKYADVAAHNRAVNNSRANKYDCAVNLLFAAVILCAFNEFIKLNLM